MIHCLRLERGADLKKSLEKYCLDNKIDLAIVLSSVGCVYRYHIRLAKAIESIKEDKHLEILCLNGTITKGNSHLHIALSDDRGNCIGGHLKEDTIIDTTCEIVLLQIENYEAQRVFDSNTGYDEIVFKKL